MISCISLSLINEDEQDWNEAGEGKGGRGSLA
jgi:hypothetical protein